MTLEWLNINYYQTTSNGIEEIYVTINRNIEEIKEIYCLRWENESVSDYDFEKSIKLVNNLIMKHNDIVNIVNEIINEYYVILNAQMELMDIDEYHDLRLLIKEAVKNTKEEMEKFKISENIELLINLKKNILKQRNTFDICNMIKKISDINIHEMAIVEPETFILPAEYIV